MTAYGYVSYTYLYKYTHTSTIIKTSDSEKRTKLLFDLYAFSSRGWKVIFSFEKVWMETMLGYQSCFDHSGYAKNTSWSDSSPFQRPAAHCTSLDRSSFGWMKSQISAAPKRSLEASGSNLEGASAGLLKLGILSIQLKLGNSPSTWKNSLTNWFISSLPLCPLIKEKRAASLSTHQMTRRLCRRCLRAHLKLTIAKNSRWHI